MSLDTMKQVAEAEAAAKQTQQQAAAEARQMIQEAEARGRQLQAEKQAQAAAEVRRMMQEAEETGARETEEAMRHAENQCAVIRAHGESRLDAASDRIIERIVIG